MEELARRFRRGAQARTGLRYPWELQGLALEYAELATGRGVSRREIAETLGLSEATLARWQEGVLSGASSALREVVIVDAPRTGGAVLVMPSGVRVEGLGTRELVVLLEALG
jgi:hypothetical protein